MTRAVYLIGGAGSGKSTFMAKLLDAVGFGLGPLIDLHSKPNAKAVVTLRGHELFDATDEAQGVYLGVSRESFPGSDGLDRATSPTGEEWLRDVGCPYRFIVSEGATLATRRFLGALDDTTELLLIHLQADAHETVRRFAERGSNQDPKFVLNTVTRSANLARFMTEGGALVMSLDTTDPVAYEMALDLSTTWIAS